MNAVPVPRIDILLRHRFWELHEAAFILVDRWPRDLCYRATPRLQWANERNVFLAPQTENGYNPKQLGPEYQKALSLLERGILSGELLNIPANLYLSCYGANQTFLIPPIEAIILGLSHDLILSQVLAKHLEIEQIVDAKKPRNVLKFTIDQTIAQFILTHEKIDSISILCRHDLMKRFGSAKKSCDKELKSIRRSLTSLFGAGKLLNYCPAPISAVRTGRAFRFSLLKELIKTITLLVVESLGPDQMGNYTEGELIHTILSGPILAMYLHDVSHFTKILTRRWCLENLFNYYSHEKIRDIPANTRKDMKITELKFININLIMKDMRVETFSPVEKETIAYLLNAEKELEQRVDPSRLPFVQNFFLEGNQH
jgi:hypothetical protein